LGFVFCARVCRKALIPLLIYLYCSTVPFGSRSGLRVVLFQIPPVDWWHEPLAFMVNELVCAASVYLLNYAWPLPIRRKLWANVPANNRPLKDKNKLPLLKCPDSRHLSYALAIFAWYILRFCWAINLFSSMASNSSSLSC
jgi:hypothetical protein